MKPDLVISGGTIVTMDPSRQIVNNGDIIIGKGKILAVTENKAALKEKYNCPVIDATNRYIFPGFINSHAHLFQTLIRGFGEGLEVLDWLEKTIDPVVENLSTNDSYISSKLGCLEAVKSGTTSILDHNYPHPVPGMAEETIRAFNEIGIRGILGRSIIDMGDIHKMIVHTTREELDACEQLLKRYANSPDKMTSVWLAPYSIMSTTKDAFLESKYLARKYQTWSTVHAATPSSIAGSIKLYGVGDTAYLESIGYLGPNLLLVHCCANLSEEELNIMRDYDCKISHNPVSNTYLAEGIAPIVAMIKKGISISLATDGPASNNNHDMLSVIKLTPLLQKVANLDTTVLSAMKTLEMATIEGAKCVGMDEMVGSIEKGKQADLIIVDLERSNTVFYDDPVVSLVYSATQENIRTVVINGKVVMEEREILTVDEEETINYAREAGKDLVKRAFNAT